MTIKDYSAISILDQDIFFACQTNELINYDIQIFKRFNLRFLGKFMLLNSKIFVIIKI